MTNKEENPKELIEDNNSIMAELDFNELLEFEKTLKSVEEQLNRISGVVYRLTKDQEALYNSEKNIMSNINVKRKELVKRYNLDDKRNWKVDINSRKIVYI
jgi:hypothetical protein